MGWNDYRYQYEPCLYGWKGKSHKFYGDRTNTNIWNIARDNVNSYQHITQKPVALANKALNNSTRENEICLDLFGGSGSTMVACHQINRICYMNELEPKYCQVIIDRMRKLDPDIVIKKNGKPYDKK